MSAEPGTAGSFEPAPARPSPDATRLWSGGIATAVVAALIGVVGVLIVRTAFRLAVYAPVDAGPFGGQGTVLLCVLAAAAALGATGLVHLLLIGTPRPLAYFGWIIGLLTAAATVLPFLSGGSVAVALGAAVIHLVIGLAIGSLVTGSALSAIRSGTRPTGGSGLR